jgi:hypothetical protein
MRAPPELPAPFPQPEESRGFRSERVRRRRVSGWTTHPKGEKSFESSEVCLVEKWLLTPESVTTLAEQCAQANRNSTMPPKLLMRRRLRRKDLQELSVDTLTFRVILLGRIVKNGEIVYRKYWLAVIETSGTSSVGRSVF